MRATDILDNGQGTGAPAERLKFFTAEAGQAGAWVLDLDGERVVLIEGEDGEVLLGRAGAQVRLSRSAAAAIAAGLRTFATTGTIRTGAQVERASERVFPSRTFTFEGRTYRLTKRAMHGQAPWYPDFAIRGRRPRASLETPNFEAAKARCIDGIIRPAKAERWDVVVGQRSEVAAAPVVATLGQVVEAFRAWQGRTHGLSERAARDYVRALEWVCARAFPGRPWESVSTGELGRAARGRYRDAVLQEYTSEATTEQGRKAALAKAATTGQSYIGQARSLFSERLLEVYAEAGLVVSDEVTTWKRGQVFDRTESVYQRPSDAVIESTFAAMDGLEKLDRNAYLAWWLAVGAGLRKGEVAAADWSWVQVVDGRPFIYAAHIGKNGETLQIPIMSEAWEKIRQHAKASGPILEGSKTERGDDVFDRIGVVMRSLGWETEKTIHEMRKFVASRLLEKYAPSLVANYTRHRSVRTLERYYARYLGTKVMDVALRAQQIV